MQHTPCCCSCVPPAYQPTHPPPLKLRHPQPHTPDHSSSGPPPPPPLKAATPPPTHTPTAVPECQQTCTHLAVVVACSQCFLNVIAGIQLWVCQQPLQAHTPLNELVTEVLRWVVELAAQRGIPVVLDGVVRAAFQQLGQRCPLVCVDLLRLRMMGVGRCRRRSRGSGMSHRERSNG